MKRSSAQKSRNPLLTWALFLLFPLASLYLLYVVIASVSFPKNRTTIVLLTDPVEVASFDPNGKQWSFVTFPVETHISGIQGLGEYAIDSLWSLAETEGSPSAVVLGSLTDELGVPIDYYLGTKGSVWKKTEGQVTGQYFTFPGIVRAFFRTYDSNIPFSLFVALTRSLREADSGSKRAITLGEGRGLFRKELPDRSQILVFDRDQFDGMSDDIFEDSVIRSERLRIAIFNTTGRPFLGSRVARVMNKLGSNVIQIGNDENTVSDCQVEGTQEHLDSRTSQLIQELFTCVPFVVNSQERADLTVRIGKQYEQRYLPK